MSTKVVYAVDSNGNRRIVGPRDVLRDGERLVVPTIAMDSSSTPANPSHAAYEAMRAAMHHTPPAPAGSGLTQAQADQMAAASIAARQSGRVSDESHGAYCASVATLDYRNRSR